MPSPLFEITDGTDSVSLIGRDVRGIHIKEWTPTINTAKGGGVFADNPIANSRQLVMRKWDNAIETLTLAVTGSSQDGVATQLQSMLNMLEKATEYWTSENQPDPVYLKVRGSLESNERYAIIHAYQLSTLNNPFAMPLFACNPSTIDGAVLTIERGHWLSVPPGTGECVEISGKQDAGFPVTRYDHPEQSSDDGYVENIVENITLGTDYMWVGKSIDDHLLNIGMRFRAVNIPAGATITAAWIKLVALRNSQPCIGTAPSGGSTSSCCGVWIRGEAVDDAPTFSTYADFAARDKTTAYKVWNIPGTVTGKQYRTPDFYPVVQEIIDRPGWAYGNDMVIFIHCLVGTVAGNNRQFATWDHATHEAPVITIKYITGVGQEETCDFEAVYVANKQSTNNLTHVYMDDGGVFSGNRLNQVLPYDLLPAVPAVNDAIYFGVEVGSGLDSSTFNSLIFDIGTPADDIQVDYEFWNGFTWSGGINIFDTTATGFTDNLAFQEEGYGSVFWEIPYSWNTTTVNGITGWWIRARVTAAPGAPVGATQQNRHVYTVSWPSVEIGSDQIVGDIPAIARIEVTSVTDESMPRRNVTRVVMGTRSKVRGDGFTSYINLSDVQTIDGVNISTNGADVSIIDDPQAATGRSIRYSPAAVVTDLDPRVYIAFESAGNVWRGKYRAFLRCTSGGTPSPFSVQLALYSSTVGVALITTKAVGVLAEYDPTGYANWQVLDFGVIDLPIGRHNFAGLDGQSKTMIAINASNNTAAANVLRLHDLILMPCDEWYGDFIIPALENSLDSGLAAYGNTLGVDSLWLPRKQLRAVAGNMALGEQRFENIFEVWRASSPGEVVLAPRTEQKIFFFTMTWNNWTTDEFWMSYPDNGLSVRVHKADRWLGLRGGA